MAQRLQRGWLKKERRIPGDTWILYFRTIRKSDGKRVENKVSIGLVKDFPDKSSAWAEVERLHLQINPVDSRRGVTFADLVLHYAGHELLERPESIHPKAHTTTPERYLQAFLGYQNMLLEIPLMFAEVAEWRTLETALRAVRSLETGVSLIKRQLKLLTASVLKLGALALCRSNTSRHLVELAELGPS